MTALTNEDRSPARTEGAAAFIDRWIFVFTAALVLTAVLGGFIPDSVTKMAAVEAGQRPPFPLILHIHAVLMGAFVLLLLAQATLMATGQRANHQRLGLISMVLGPLLIVVGFILVPVMRHQFVDGMLAAPPDVAAAMRPGLEFQVNIMLVQIRIGLMFAILLTLALLARRSDANLHKRLMILAVIAALPAAIDRMTWVHSTLPDSPLSTDLYPMLIAAPMFFWDLYRKRRILKAYWIYAGLSLALAIPVYLLWGTPEWRAFSLQLLGISGV